MTARTVAQGEAVRLFAERAALARPGFTVDAGNHAAITRICRWLDGIPLAIELAALRVRAMPVTKILTGLHDYLGFLATGSRVAMPGCRRCGRRSIGASCSARRRSSDCGRGRRCSPTGSTRTRPKRSAPAQASPSRTSSSWLAALVDKSVLTRTHDGTNISARYRMLEAIRHYGQEHLAASSQLTAVRARHRDHYRCLATQAEQEWLGPNELAWLARLWRAHPNLRAALEFCLTEPGQARAGWRSTPPCGTTGSAPAHTPRAATGSAKPWRWPRSPARDAPPP
ncbi:hypothetical protein DMH04_49895 [Kibdelosporangium aridum]|uniref:Uncharacterized protein n=1 Tax=Kibdelosporangium aridum TaxID=2030 RepID=A0A428YBX6_KIBAR|nr:hypothetical protein [Kibdelosporangium aridum]RSM65077.1 hypothetical protein DMH04_49895 [Kibdelosporangium aridum]